MTKLVTIGGGTGTFVVLTGLRKLPDVSLTAVVSAADDGGSTGRLRDAYGFLPPGDARQALVALAEDGDVLRDLFAYRFTKGEMAGHNLGNLFITALNDLLGSGPAALQEASRILRIRGTVIPATEEAATLKAEFEDGMVIEGESNISEPAEGHARIKRLSLAEPLPLTRAAEDAIKSADLIILGPGSLYSSTIAALLPDGMKEAVAASPARLAYVVNLFTKAGQTEGFSMQDHLDEVARYAGRMPERIFVHEGSFAPDVLALYAREREYPVPDDLPHDARIVRLPLASVNVVAPVANDPLRRSFIRHDSDLLATALATLMP